MAGSEVVGELAGGAVTEREREREREREKVEMGSFLWKRKLPI
jgi:hypothetical protein